MKNILLVNKMGAESMFKKSSFFIFITLLSLVILGCIDEEPLKEEAAREESPLFESDGYTMIGNEGRLGFIYDDTEAVRFYPDKVQSICGIFGEMKMS